MSTKRSRTELITKRRKKSIKEEIKMNFDFHKLLKIKQISSKRLGTKSKIKKIKRLIWKITR